MKLVYFDGRGLAETSRLILALVNEKYEDFRYPMKIIDWSTHNIVKTEFDKDKNDGKLSMSLNRLPYLEDNGTIISQSKAIERYLARKHKLMGSSEEEAAVIDSLCEYVRDFKDDYKKTKQKHMSNNEQDKLKLWFTEYLAEKLALFEKLLSNNVGYSVNNKNSLADIVLFSFITEFFDDKESVAKATQNAPKLNEIINRVRKDENIQAWLNKRPDSQF